MVEYVLFGVVELLLIDPLLVDELLLLIEFELLFIEFELSVVTGEVYVGFVAVLVVEYVLVVVWAFAMPIPHRQTARMEN